MKTKLNNIINKNITKIIVYAVSGLFAVCLVFFVVAAIYSSVDRMSGGNIKERLAEYETIIQNATTRETSRSQWRNIDDIFKKFKNDYLLKMDDYSQLRTELQVILNKNRLRLIGRKGMRHEYSSTFPDIIRVTITFSAAGIYPDFKRFIHEITTQTYPKKMVLFRNIQISKKEQGEIIGDFAMETYLAN